MKALLRVSIGLALVANGLGAVTDLFQIDFDTNLNGGCQYVGLENMNNLALDAASLATIGRQLMIDYGNHVPEAVRLVDSFFTVEEPPSSDEQQALLLSDEQQALLYNNYDVVANWLWYKGDYNLGGSGVDSGRKTMPPNPFLLCHSNAYQKISMSDYAYDSTGQPLMQQNGEQVQLRDVPQYRYAQQDYQAALDAEGNPATAVPYWFGRGLSYIFDEDYGPGLSYCTFPSNQASTENFPPVSIALFCPESFGAQNPNFDPSNPPTVNIRRRLPCNPVTNAVPRARLPQEEGELDPNLLTLKSCYPTAETLLHETFHLVLGATLSCPASPQPEVYNVLVADNSDQRLVGLPYSIASRNAESLAVAAVAYDYTFSTDPDENGNRLEFFSGYATQG